MIAVTGASAQPLAERSIELLLKYEKQVNLILSKGAYKVWQSEVGIKVPLDPKLQEKFWRNRFNEYGGKLTCHRWNDLSATIASGSYLTKGMIIIPCTMGTIGRIASGSSQGLIERCADVHLKECRPLVIAPRESPFNLIHINNIKTLAECGAKIVPPIPAWYSKPRNLDEMIDFLVVRLFDSLGEEVGEISRWQGAFK